VRALGEPRVFNPNVIATPCRKSDSSSHFVTPVLHQTSVHLRPGDVSAPVRI
jgi:hypothetical protein